MSQYLEEIKEILGDDGDSLLNYTCWGIPSEMLIPPAANFVDRLSAETDRPIPVLRSLQTLFNTGRLGGTGYLSILPVDQGVEHSAGASFALNPIYFDPEHIVKLAIEAECSAVASTLGVLGSMARKYAHRIPFILKINHNELLSYPNTYDQVLFASVKQAQDMGALAVGATIYFGSPESRRQIQEVSMAFRMAHEMGMATILWCYLRNKAFKTKEKDYHLAADLTGQANYLGATIEADIVKQKLPVVNGGFRDLHFGKTSSEVYEKLVPEHPIDLLRYQVANCYMGRVGLISSGGASMGTDDLKEAVKTAVINKRGGGMGLILGRKAFQRPFREGIHIIQNVQNVYLEKEIALA
ncbi:MULTISPECIES: class I fructose-bisphosphate aldolase [Aminobacterium]|jgi:class I fructose-bisphosphate aldolase|uniref:class I fructose-bisphosphate aldolase n=1 Tax=Aminobacterium TaxID=81466 RepID=UPI000A7EAEEB|nr:class I fructose-bisphosphate aldolase [Aminobacterium sp. EBM-42]MDD2378976.1 class I fructose-bisphosphate aldolase [Aminobacterium colombiense]MDD4265579.1 class I fructose-bisphosphate aldolase [Aminobacterium colombiense]MDD4585807.1 class I fructose-bisphosphate aldolase [Aminobacterium colombiense]NLK30611.1 class I fructose-bisphosphate aldolase [Aminobacterium colombiense]